MIYKPSIAVTLTNTALNLASEKYAAQLWRDGAWDWYEILRSTLATAAQAGQRLDLRHLQFAYFVNAHAPLRLDSKVDSPDEQIFKRRPIPREIENLAGVAQTLHVDDCPLFSFH